MRDALIGTAAIVALLAYACSSTGGAPAGGGTNNVSGGGSSATGAGATTTGSGATATTGTGGSGFDLGGETRTTTFEGPDGSCAAESRQAEQIVIEEPVEITEEVTIREPVTLNLMLDQSGSMLFDLVIPPKWDQAVAAINAFITDPSSEGLYVAIQYFPLLGIGQCNGAGYSTPEVGPVRLLAEGQQISGSLAAHAPVGPGTPLEGGLRGVTDYCLNSYVPPEPNAQCVAVLITDGEPTDCDQNGPNLVNIAASAYGSGILTFAIGMQGADFALLDQIATAGGTSCGATPACNVSGGGTDFIAALETIRNTVTQTVTRTETRTVIEETALPCNFVLPAPPEGEEFDKELVNVQFASASSPQPQTVPRVLDQADCAAVDGGWYYDNAGAPSEILLCDNTCSTVQGVSGAQIDIALGCATEIAVVE